MPGTRSSVFADWKSVGYALDLQQFANCSRYVDLLRRALYAVFTAAAHDPDRDAKTRSKMKGLAKHLASVQFVNDIGLMYDVLQELSSLSLELQKQAMTLDKADRLVKRTIHVLESFVDNPSEHSSEANTAKERMEFKTVELLDIVKQKAIDRQQFIQSVVDNLRLWLCEPDEADAQILEDCLVFDTDTWPTLPENRFGEKEVRRLCQRFSLDPAPESASKQAGGPAKKSFTGTHGERRTWDAEGVEFEAPRVETPKVSRGGEWEGSFPLPSRLWGLWVRAP